MTNKQKALKQKALMVEALKAHRQAVLASMGRDIADDAARGKPIEFRYEDRERYVDNIDEVLAVLERFAK